MLLDSLTEKLIPKEVFEAWEQMKRGEFNPRNPAQYIALKCAFYERSLIYRGYSNKWPDVAMLSTKGIKLKTQNEMQMVLPTPTQNIFYYQVDDSVTDIAPAITIGTFGKETNYIFNSFDDLDFLNVYAEKRKGRKIRRFNYSGVSYPSTITNALDDIIPWRPKIAQYPSAYYYHYYYMLDEKLAKKYLIKAFNLLKQLDVTSFRITGGLDYIQDAYFQEEKESFRPVKLSNLFTIRLETDSVNDIENVIESTKGHIKQRIFNHANIADDYDIKRKYENGVGEYTAVLDKHFSTTDLSYSNKDYELAYYLSGYDYCLKAIPHNNSGVITGVEDYTLYKIFTKGFKKIKYIEEHMSYLMDMDIDANPYFYYQIPENKNGDVKRDYNYISGELLTKPTEEVKPLLSPYDNYCGDKLDKLGAIFDYYNHVKIIERPFGYIRARAEKTHACWKRDDGTWYHNFDNTIMNDCNSGYYCMTNSENTVYCNIKNLANVIYESKSIKLKKPYFKDIKTIYARIQYQIGRDADELLVEVPFTRNDNELTFDWMSIVKQHVPGFVGDLHIGEGLFSQKREYDEQIIHEVYGEVLFVGEKTYTETSIYYAKVTIPYISIITGSGFFVFSTKDSDKEKEETT